MSDKITICDGKYTFHLDSDGTLRCDRYDDKDWREFIGNGAVLALFQECLELKVENNILFQRGFDLGRSENKK